MIRGFIWRVRRLFAWLPILWNDADFDHAYLLRILELKLRRMAGYPWTYGHHAGNERYAQQMTEAAILCRRMADENYIIEPYVIPKEEAMYRQDLERLFLLFRKHLRTWWN